MTAVLDAPLVGSRAPRIRSVAPGVDEGWGREAAELLELVGFDPDPWQRDTLDDQMRRAGDRWAARDVGLVVPRQNGKTILLLARALHMLFLGPPGSLAIYSSHSFRAATEFWRVLADCCQDAQLRRRVKVIRGSHGEESVETHAGNRVRVLARQVNTARGYSADLLLLDEAFSLTDEQWASILPTISARPDPQLVLASSAGTVDSSVLARFRRRALDGGEGRLVYHEWSAPDDLRDDDPLAAAVANPTLGARLAVEAVESERATMSGYDFARERLGRWSLPPVKPADLAVDLDAFRAALDPAVTTPPEGAAVELAFDAGGLAHRRGTSDAAIAAAWEQDGRVRVVLVGSGPGTGWLAPRLAGLVAKWCPGRPVRYNSVAGVRDVAAQLERAGVLVGPVATAAYVDSWSDFARRLADRTLLIAPADPLLEAAEVVPRRRLGEGWVPDRAASPVVASPLVAVALAAWAVRVQTPVVEPAIF